MIRFILSLSLIGLFAVAAYAAPGDVITTSATAFTNVSGGQGGKAKATKAKDTVTIQGSGGLTVTANGKTVTVDGSNKATLGEWVNFGGLTIPDYGDITVGGSGGYAGTTISNSAVDTGTIQATQISDGVGTKYVSEVIDAVSHRNTAGNPHALTADQLPGLAAVALSNSYNDLDNKPPIPVNPDWFATTGLAQILNKPAETCEGRLSWDGIDGTQIFFGSGAPDAGTGIEKDFYINSANWNFYRKEGAPVAWVLKGNMVGPANTLTIGTVTTLAYDQQATATISGTAPNQTLSLGLVQGTPGPPVALSRDAIITEMGEPSDTVLYITPGTNSGTVGGVVINDYGTNAAVIIQNGRVEVRDTSGVTIAKIDRAAGTVATYDTSGNLSTKLDRNGGIYAYKASNAVGMSYTRSAGALVIY